MPAPILTPVAVPFPCELAAARLLRDVERVIAMLELAAKVKEELRG